MYLSVTPSFTLECRSSDTVVQNATTSTLYMVASADDAMWWKVLKVSKELKLSILKCIKKLKVKC